MLEEKTILDPSGLQEGALLVPLNRGKLTTLPASTEYMQISGLTGPFPPLEKHVKAMREMSGDQRGVSEIDRSEVSGC